MSDTCCPPQATCPDSDGNIVSPGQTVSRKDLPPSVIGEVITPAGPVPRVTTGISGNDRLGIWKVRWGIGRYDYTVPPGVYAVGEPGSDSEVLVTANYRMTFDLLRGSLESLSAWILVLDTKGINVWCAAGKGTFGTDELVRQIENTEISRIVEHRRLIVPQLGAPGVAAHRVRERTGFAVLFGPVEMRDIREYLENGRKASPAMRKKDFPLAERAAIVPMELVPAAKWILFISIVIAMVSGLLGRGTFSADALYFGSRSLLALAIGTFAGAVAAPLLLPWIPGRAFALKGALTGAAASLVLPLFTVSSKVELTAWILVIISLSSYFTMNFTGSSTYTSLSGVKKEMREAVPFQITAASGGLVLWIIALFTGGTA